MSLKPIDPKHLSPDDVEAGSGAQITNGAQSMRRYTAQQHRRPGTGAATPPDLTGGMRAYTPHAEPPKDKKKALLFATGVIVVVVAAVVAVAFGLASCSDDMTNEQTLSGKVTVTIPSNYGAGDIAQLLREEGVIGSTTEFIQAVNQGDSGSALKAGTYTFEAGAPYDQIVSDLVAGPEASGLVVTIPEGFTVDETAARVEKALGIPADTFLAQAKASNYVGEFTFLSGAYNDSLEGFLFPKTYSFAEGVTADTVIRAMLNQFVTETAGLDWTSAIQGSVALSQYEVVCMASLIERETAVVDERPLVASVIFNRLNIGMQLQIDASIAYALNKTGLLSLDDLNVDSPYNLYLNYGLTPGPICSPSLSSIQAVLEAAQTDYVYYVAAPALDGTHTFCVSYEEFVVARNAYNQAAGLS